MRHQTELITLKTQEKSAMLQIQEISKKIKEFEQNKRNNLIFYGVSNDANETFSSLNQKIAEIIRLKLQIHSNITLDKVYVYCIG